MSNDIDSYYSCCKLQEVFNLDIGGFYSFEDGLYLNQSNADCKEPVYVDLSVSRGKTFDNHYTFIKNPDAINPNIIHKRYYEKFNGSTYAMMLSLFGGYENMTEEQWIELLCLDGFYSGYFNADGKYRDVNLYWFDLLGISDYVLPILQSYDADTFSSYIQQNNLTEHIYIDDQGKLYSKLNIILPDHQYDLVQSTRKKFVSKVQAVMIYNRIHNGIFVSNELYRDKYVLNIAV